MDSFEVIYILFINFVQQAAAFIHRYLNLDERALREILPDNSEGL